MHRLHTLLSHHAPVPGHGFVELQRQEDLEEDVARKLQGIQEPPGEVADPGGLLLQPFGRRDRPAVDDDVPEQEEEERIDAPQRREDGDPGDVDLLISLEAEEDWGV